MQHFDVVIVGAGMAGASLAWQLSQPGPTRRTVLVLERESQPGVHSTGRSAAMFMPSYGPACARALTRASRDFYLLPPAGFIPGASVLGDRGALYVATPDQVEVLNATAAELQATGSPVDRLSTAECLSRMPVLRPDQVLGGLFEAEARDIDVHALHQGYLQGARRAGVPVWTDAPLARARHDGARWTLGLADSRELQATCLVDAAGAWADEVATLAGLAPLGLVPRRRSAFTFDPPPGQTVRDWPLVAGVAVDWYLKPDAGRLLGSPANADATMPHDVRPEELDIALGIDRIERATSLTIRRPTSTWAGLRTFAADDELVIGSDPAQPAFFWLAGQGGYGIQSAHGAAMLAADLIAGRPPRDELRAEGVASAAVSPARLAR